MTDRVIRLTLATVEGIHLAGLVEEFVSLLATSRDGADPALARLTPDIYPDDATASAEFAAATRGDLLNRRVEDAGMVRAALAPFLIIDAQDLSEDEALIPQDAIIASTELDAWLRTLAALRLVIASRLDITSDDDAHDPEDPRFGVYDWLGYRLESLIEIADAQDRDTH